MTVSRAQKILCYVFSSSDFVLLVPGVHKDYLSRKVRDMLRFAFSEVTELWRGWTRGSETTDRVDTCSDPRER